MWSKIRRQKFPVLVPLVFATAVGGPRPLVWVAQDAA